MRGMGHVIARYYFMHAVYNYIPSLFGYDYSKSKHNDVIFRIANCESCEGEFPRHSLRYMPPTTWRHDLYNKYIADAETDS